MLFLVGVVAAILILVVIAAVFFEIGFPAGVIISALCLLGFTVVVVLPVTNHGLNAFSGTQWTVAIFIVAAGLYTVWRFVVRKGRK